MIRGIGVGFRDAVSLITRKTSVQGGVKSKAPLSGIPFNTWLLLATVVCARFCLSMRVGCGDESWGQDDVM